MEVEGGMPLVRLEFSSVEEALSRAGDHGSSWVQILFPPGIDLGREEVRAISKAYPYLANIGFKIPGAVELGLEPEGIPSLEDPAELFRAFYRRVKGTKPPAELVELFIRYFREVALDETASA